MKRFVVPLGVSIALVISGVAAGAVFSSSGSSTGPAAGAQSRESDEPREADTRAADGAGVHGGPIDRFHGSGACGLTAVGGLAGNWTHGDYVDAVATATGDSTLVMQAAQSDCGKPMVAVNHGGGPPANALASREAHVPDQATEHGPPLSVPPSGS